MIYSIIKISNMDPKGLFSKLVLPPKFLKRTKETRFQQNWVMSLNEYILMMSNKFPIFPYPHRQRGSIGHFVSTVALSSGLVVFTGATVSSIEFNSTSTSGVRFNNGGSISRNDDGGYNQINNGEWWSAEPETDIGSRYDVQALSAGKVGTWSNSGAADDTWIQMNVAREWNVVQSSVGTKNTAATIEIRTTGSGSALDSGTIDCTAEFTI